MDTDRKEEKEDKGHIVDDEANKCMMEDMNEKNNFETDFSYQKDSNMSKNELIMSDETKCN